MAGSNLDTFLPYYWRYRTLAGAATAPALVLLGSLSPVLTVGQGVILAAMVGLTIFLPWLVSRARPGWTVVWGSFHLVFDLSVVFVANVMVGEHGWALLLVYPMMVALHTVVSGPIGGIAAALLSLVLIFLSPMPDGDLVFVLFIAASAFPVSILAVSALRRAHGVQLRRMVAVNEDLEAVHRGGSGGAGAILARSLLGASTAEVVVVSLATDLELAAAATRDGAAPDLSVARRALSQRRIEETLGAGVEVVIRREEATPVESSLLGSLTALPLDIVRVIPIEIGGGDPGFLIVGYVDAKAAAGLEERAVVAVYATQAAAVLARALGQRALAEVDRVKVAFLSAAGHGLITPLTSAKGLVELLVADGDRFSPEPRRAFLSTTADSLARMEQVVEHLSDLERMLRTEIEAIAEPVAVAAVARARVERSMVHIAGRTVQVDVADPLRVLADPVLLDRVFAHVLLNAVQATADDGTITVRAILVGDEVAVEVVDDGCGMDAALLARATHLFERGDVHEASGNGLGVGLAFVERAMQRMGGAVALSSQVGDGTSVTLTFPAVPVGGEKNAVPPLASGVLLD